VSIDPEKKRPIDSLLPAVQTDCLRDGQDVPFIEGSVEGRAPVADVPNTTAAPQHADLAVLIIRRKEFGTSTRSEALAIPGSEISLIEGFRYSVLPGKAGVRVGMTLP